MKAFTRALAGITCGLAIVLGIFSLAWTFALEGTPLEDAIGVGLTNAALDASGVKGRMEDALRSSTGAIAEATGMSEDQVNAAIDQLDISSWSAMALPADATATGSFTTSYQGAEATVTTYADPSYITVDAYGQTITLSVPESAQQYVSLLGYL
ncbi:hypothetical protein [[Collinsella] massiliensis]|uniref:Uncharacterized protein n=1 Tax=[Collinsella] massiliensis TaxID=1232426 RepID=A0A1Y3XXI9_9ACTN|nr:hypothetical protein [[Collinsella] massiliensis]OUN89841.1 hypothetical protein B5G02_00360 [[Collinsella] massiliensis]